MNLKQFCEIHWYTLKDRIDFKWWRHWDWIPTVTEILQLLYDPWFEYVKRAHPITLNKAAEEWTRIHKQAEDYFNWDSNDVKNLILQFHLFNDVKTLHQEKTFYKWWLHNFRWTVDKIWEIESIIYNMDYKNSDHQSPKHKVQMWWYKDLDTYNWILVYVWTKLEVVYVESFYQDIFIELKDYFFTLL